MRVLVHLGLNKCASTYIQHALHAARPTLALAGCWYPLEDGPPCQYGLSRHYGFGPDDDHIAPRSLDHLIDTADQQGCSRVILSSEYLSLYRPRAAERFVEALDQTGCRAEFVLFSRDVPGWVVSLFNQYVRTVDGGRYLPDISAFVDQILRNRAVDVAARYRLWHGLTGSALKHYAIQEGRPEDSVLAPFSAFAGAHLATPERCSGNASLGTNALFRVGQLRAAARSTAEEEELHHLLMGGATTARAPKGYMTIADPLMARLEDDIIAPYRTLPVDALPTPAQTIPVAVAAAKRPAPRLSDGLALASALLPSRLDQRTV